MTTKTTEYAILNTPEVRAALGGTKTTNSPTPRPEHRYCMDGISLDTMYAAMQAKRVAMSLDAYLALDFDPDCYLYNEESKNWRRVEPDACTQEPGAFIGEAVYSPNYPVFVPIKQLLDRGGCSVTSHASLLSRVAELETFKTNAFLSYSELEATRIAQVNRIAELEGALKDALRIADWAVRELPWHIAHDSEAMSYAANTLNDARSLIAKKEG